MSKVSSIVVTVVIAIIALAVLAQVQRVAERAYSGVNREAAVATVNGGDYEFNAQQIAKEGGKWVNTIFFFATIGIIVIGGVRIVKIAKREDECDGNDGNCDCSGK